MTDIGALLRDLDDTPEVRETYQRAPFGYPGGKSRSVEHILPHLPYYHTFVEHMGGSGIVILNRRSSKLDVFNDRCSGVTAFYRCIQDYEKMRRLQERLDFTIHSREEFIFCKETWDKIEEDVERAARWYYMVQVSFANKQQAFARATHSKAPIKAGVNLKLFPAIHGRFKTIQVDNLDFRISAKDYDSADTVHYFDPPYLGADSGIYTHGFRREDHVDMLNLIQHLQGFVAVSSYQNALYDSYSWDSCFTWDVPVTMKAMAHTDTNHQKGRQAAGDDERGQATECLYIREAK